MKPIVLIALLFSASVSFSQGLTETFDENCNCYTITNHFDNGQVSSEHHENVDRKRIGSEKVYSADGHLNYERSWKAGKLHGDGTFYHPDGSIYATEHYNEGEKVGKWIFQDRDGTPIQIIEYVGNGNDGTYDYYHTGVKYFTQALENGQLVSTEIINQEIYDIIQEEGSATSK